MDSSDSLESNVQRTFRDLSLEEIADVERAFVLARAGWSGAFGWDRLLESKRVLIISEAGAGKTHECRTQQQALWHKGEPAFYLDLAELATNNLRDLLSADEEARLEAWLAAQSDVATFFLDSIDELKLTLGSFETALKRLSKAVSGQLGRVRIIITTRPIAVDQQLIQEQFPVPDPVNLVASGDAFADIAMGRHQQRSGQQERATPPVWRNVALMPLSDEQIRKMVAVEGIGDADALLTDIRARNAEDFARRPQDLIELCADWREHHRIRTHREQVEQNIQIKLRARSDRRESAQLSPDKAFEGASRLALAAVLSRKLTIRHSVEADRGGEPRQALDPATVLHDWTPQERETLLERALFGFASYGRVRFHHRSVVEFLAARRLDDRLGQGMPIKSVKRLLFAETLQGIRIVRPTMRPVAAWLAASRPSIFSEVRIREPNVLLDHADPESLPLPQRVDALRSYAQLYGLGGWRGLQVPQVQVHRFASPDLAAHVAELWRAGIENEEVRELLLDLIGAGPMPSCADIAHGVALDASATDGERLGAIAALVLLHDHRIEEVTQSMLNAPALWPDATLRGVVVRLFPRHIAPNHLCEILGRVGESASSVGLLSWMLPREIAGSELSRDYLATLRAGLTALVTDGLSWRKEWPHIVGNRAHLLPALAAVCLSLIRVGQTDAEVLHSSVIALRLERENHAEAESIQNLGNELGELAAPLREAIFWADDAFSESLHPEADPWSRLFNTRDGPIKLNYRQDGAWVRRILADPGRPLPERTMMLHASIFGVRDGAGNPRDYIESLKEHVDDQPALIAIVDHYLAPREIDPQEAEFESKIERQRKAAKRREAKHHADWVAFWREVAEHPETAFSPDRAGSTAWNLWQAMQRSGNDSRASGWNRRFVEQYFDKDVADRLRASMRSIWRKDRPTLRHERLARDRGTILIRWQLGLAAIAAEAEELGWARKLSVEEAELAARYAPIELNGFPTWLDALACEHPVAVERTLGPALTAELDEIGAHNSFDILLQNLSHAPAAVTSLLLPRLRTWLDTRAEDLRDGEDEKAAFQRLERVLEILLEHGNEDMRCHIRTLADGRLKVASNGSFAQVWLTTLLRLDPAAGTEALECRLVSLDPEAVGAATNIFATLFGDRHGNLRVDLRRPDFTPALLLRLVRLAYRYVCPSDDIRHEGVYTPGPRDEAQNGRNALLSAILDTTGAEAWAIKLEMAKDPLFAHFRDRLALLAREKAAEEVDGAAYTEAEVAAFDRYGEAPPTTRDDMFAVLVDRLDDLDDLLLQDVSPRAAWAAIDCEKVMRQQIALELRHASNHVYTVDQEAVTADEKETDIRLRAPSSGLQGAIELKIGERWSGRELLDTIKNQLVTKYMAAECCRSGCLLVTVASNRTWKHPDTGAPIDIDELRAILDAECVRVIDEFSGCIRISVKVLDLRPRLAAAAPSRTNAGGVATR